MARRAEKPGAPAAPQGAVGANDLAILHPDAELEIGGRKVTVREYGFFEGGRIREQAKPFFSDLYALFDADGAAPSFDDISSLLVRHEDLVVGMVAAATGMPAGEIHALGDEDGEALMVTWWMVNAGFFTRRVLRRAAQERFAQGSQRAGVASSTSSSAPDTSAPSPSSAP